MNYWWVGLLLACQTALAESNPFPQVAGAYLVEVDRVVLWQNNADRRMPSASLAKLMTVLLVLEQTRPDATVEISRSSARETGTRLGAPVGSHFTVKDLLKAVLLGSANDACHALAEHMAGNEAAFVALMNTRATSMGLLNTHFDNACGHDAPGQYTTAHDLARLAHLAMENRFVRDVARLPQDEISPLDSRQRFKLGNKNALIGRYDGAVGLKTGYTPKAGKCLIAYARRAAGQGEKQVLLVLLNAPNRWWDAVDMLDLAFANAVAVH